MDNKTFLDKQIETQRQFENKIKKYLPEYTSLPYWISNIVAFLLIGGLSFVSVQFDPTQILKFDFWLPILITSSAVWLVFFYTTKEYIIKYEKRDTEISTLKKVLIDKAKGNTFDDLPVYLANKNIVLKTQAYKEKWKRYENKIDYRASDKDLYVWTKGSVVEKQANKYCQKKLKIARVTSDEYIVENLPYLKVKVIQFTYAMVVAGTSGKYDKSSFETNIDRKISNEAIYSIISRTAMLVALGVLIISENAITISTFIKLIGNLTVLTSAFFRAVLLASDLVGGTIKEQVLERISIIEDYNKWNKKLKENTQILENPAK